MFLQCVFWQARVEKSAQGWTRVENSSGDHRGVRRALEGLDLVPGAASLVASRTTPVYSYYRLRMRCAAPCGSCEEVSSWPPSRRASSPECPVRQAV